MTILLKSFLPFFSPFEMDGSDKQQDSFLNLDLQFFGKDGDPGDGDPGDDPGDKGDSGDPGDEPGGSDDRGGDDKGGKDEKLFTQEQVNKLIKDRVARAVKDKEEAIKEAEKLAKMNAEQKREYELEKLKRENEALKAAQNRYDFLFLLKQRLYLF